MNASDRRALKLITQSKGDVRASLLSFLSKPKHYKKPIQKAREAKEQKERLSKRGGVDAIYKAVEKRAAGWCECGCGRQLLKNTWLWHPELDEWLNGNGRRQQKRAVATCWMLTRYCHRLRQRYAGGAPLWNSLFEKHCAKYGYRFEGHIEHAALLRKSSRALGLGQRVPPSPASSPDARDLPKVNQ